MQVYNALFGGEDEASQAVAKKTMLLIVYDEHGGNYDHVSPPRCVPPHNVKPTSDFVFQRLGVRVPAIFVSPYIRPHTVLRSPSEGAEFDHTSIISSIRTRWQYTHRKRWDGPSELRPVPPMTARDENAPTFWHVLDSQNWDDVRSDRRGPALVKRLNEKLAKLDAALDHSLRGFPLYNEIVHSMSDLGRERLLHVAYQLRDTNRKLWEEVEAEVAELKSKVTDVFAGDEEAETLAKATKVLEKMDFANLSTHPRPPEWLLPLPTKFGPNSPCPAPPTCHKPDLHESVHIDHSCTSQQ